MSRLKSQKLVVLVAVGIVALIAVNSFWQCGDRSERTPHTSTDGDDATLRLTPRHLSTTHSDPAPMSALPPPLTAAPCDVDEILGSLRGSPSREYRIYLLDVFGRTAPTLGDDELKQLYLDERDPAALLVVGVHLAERFNKTQSRPLLDALMQRAQNESDPVLRAEAVAVLSDLGNAGAEALGRLGVANYDQLILDPAPEVRERIVTALQTQHGIAVPRMRETGRVSIRAARATNDPALATRLIEKLNLETAGAEERTDLAWLLGEGTSDELRAAAARAMGSLAVAERDEATETLLAQYRDQSAPVIRAAILAALVRLHFAGAIPILESLRPIDARMNTEIVKWLQVLATGRQQWHLLLRHKALLDQQG